MITEFEYRDFTENNIEVVFKVIEDCKKAINSLPEGIFGYDIHALKSLNKFDSYYSESTCSYRNILLDNLEGIIHILKLREDILHMKPAEKSPEINEILNAFYGREEKINKNVCVFCGKKVTPDSFRDDISLKEYTISGLCQQCQDKVFGVDDE